MRIPVPNPCFVEIQALVSLTWVFRCKLFYGDIHGKVGSQEITWSNRRVCPWSTKSSRMKANRTCHENTLVIANTIFQQHKRQLYTWTLPDGQ